MPHCTKCGTAVADAAAFCQNCGQPTGAESGATQSGLSENAAGGLSYVLGWVTGLIFILIDRRPYVRFHAAQAIVVFGGLHILRVVLGGAFGMGWMFGHWGFWTGFGVGALLLGLLSLITFVLWVVLMVKAFQGERFRIPIAADLADSFVGR